VPTRKRMNRREGSVEPRLNWEKKKNKKFLSIPKTTRSSKAGDRSEPHSCKLYRDVCLPRVPDDLNPAKATQLSFGVR